MESSSRHVPCQSRDPEVAAVRRLEVLNPLGLSLKELEDAFKDAFTPITRILLSYIIEQSLGMSLEDINDKLGSYVDSSYLECPNVDSRYVECSTDIPSSSSRRLSEIFSWAQSECECTKAQGYEVLRFYKIIRALYPDYEDPCSEVEDHGFGTWRELTVHATQFMNTPKISFSSTLQLLRYLRGHPFLDCTSSAKRDVDPSTLEQDECVEPEEWDLEMFDAKLETAKSLFPIINKLVDPSLVMLETVGGGPIPQQVEALIASIAAATVCPLPSGHIPVNLTDPAGPPGAVFSSIYRLHNAAEAKIFAGMLRTVLADASNAGGASPPTRVIMMSMGAGAFRVF